MTMTECIAEAIRSVQEANFTGATSDNISSMACTLYINSNKPAKSSGGGGGNWKKDDTPAIPMPQGYVLGVCPDCGSPNAWSKKGKEYCSAKCWMN